MIALRLTMGVLFWLLAAAELQGSPAVPFTGEVGPFSAGLQVLAMSVEICVGFLFLFGRVRLAGCIGSIFFLVALGYGLAFPQQDCGCLGGWIRLSAPGAHAMAAALGGMLCAAAWSVAGRVRVPAG